MNIQRLAEAYYHIWLSRIEGQRQFRGAKQKDDYLPASLHERVMYWKEVAAKELDTVKWSTAQAKLFDDAIITIRCKIPYVKSMSRDGQLFTIHIVGDATIDIRDWDAKFNALTNRDAKVRYMNILTEALRNAFL